MNEIKIKTQKERQLEDFLQAYLVCALWSSNHGDEGTPFDNDYCIDDFALEATLKAKGDCEKFLADNDEIFDDLEDYNASDAGHDFWLTRNHHGAGFWDREQLEANKLGDLLTNYTHEDFKGIDVVLGDDGKLYLE